MTGTAVLVLNCGSSSVKFALVDPASGRAQRQRPRRTGRHPTTASVRGPPGRRRSTSSRPQDDVASAASWRHLLARPRPGRSARRSSGVGHRVVHGGSRFSASVVDRRRRARRRCAAWSTSRRCTSRPTSPASSGRAAELPELPQVAVFDTAFHQTMPPRRLPLRRADGVVRDARRAPLRLPRHEPPLRQRPGRRAARPAAGRSCGWSPRTSATAAARPPSATAAVGRHHDGPDPARGPGDGHPQRRRRPGPAAVRRRAARPRPGQACSTP